MNVDDRAGILTGTMFYVSIPWVKLWTGDVITNGYIINSL